MEDGSITPGTDMYGYPMQKQVFVRTPAEGIGFIPITDGPGYLLTVGDGRLFITGAGCMKKVMDGYGCLATNGRRPGLPGGTVAAIMDGRH